MKIAIAALTLSFILGCKSGGEGEMAGNPWAKKLGQEVTVEGVAQDAKEGALLEMADDTIWIDMDSWPNGLRGKRVVVRGKVIERYDRPVFVQKKDEPIKSGIPVPEGTDLHKASHRYLIANATWSLKQ